MTPRSWDVFCRVIDNFGDAAVCWRLARALAALPEHPAVRLGIDHREVLGALVPELARANRHDGVDVLTLDEVGACESADVVVDGFGVGLPERYAQAMAARPGPQPLWIVLEYLSAEPWVAAHHGLPSPHPRLPIERYFFFPGFGPDTGGLLREPDLDARRTAFLAEPGRRAAFWRDAGFAAPAGERIVTLFAYDDSPVEPLLEAWSQGGDAIIAAVPAGRIEARVASFMDAGPEPRSGRSMRRGALEVRFLPFLSQERYDELLWTAHWNFVRGEDSFVRAQWARRPLVWQPYLQADAAHLAKLDAFLERYLKGLEAPVAVPLDRLFRAWNGTGPTAALADAWNQLAAHGERLERHAAGWAVRAAEAGDLAINLARFCTERL